MEIFDKDAGWLADQPDPSRYEIAVWRALDKLAAIAASVAANPPHRTLWLRVEQVLDGQDTVHVTAGGRSFDLGQEAAIVLREATR
jgi:hypothetical protein